MASAVMTTTQADKPKGLEVSLLCSEPRHKWKELASMFQFTEPPHICRDKGCPNAVRHRLKCVHSYDIDLDLQREVFLLHTAYSSSTPISYSNWPTIKKAINAHFRMDEYNFTHIRQDIAILKFFGSHEDFDQLFVWVNLQTRSILAVSGYRKDDLIEFFDSELSRDGSILASMYVHVKRSKGSHLRPLDTLGQNLISLYSTTTGHRSSTFMLPFAYEPSCMAFDPDFKDNSRLLVFSRSAQTLGAMCLNARRTVKSVRLTDIEDEEVDEKSWVKFSKDGRFIILVIQGIDFDIVRAVTYVLDSVSLKQIIRIPAEIDISNIPCSVDYTPAFSKCGTKMCILKNHKGSTDDIRSFSQGFETLHLQVYQLPCEMSLSYMCRTVILQALHKEKDVKKLPLPKSLQRYIDFTPDLACTTSKFVL